VDWVSERAGSSRRELGQGEGRKRKVGGRRRAGKGAAEAAEAEVTRGKSKKHQCYTSGSLEANSEKKVWEHAK
jgi:transposase-like protein